MGMKRIEGAHAVSLPRAVDISPGVFYALLFFSLSAPAAKVNTVQTYRTCQSCQTKQRRGFAVDACSLQRPMAVRFGRLGKLGTLCHLFLLQREQPCRIAADVSHVVEPHVRHQPERIA